MASPLDDAARAFSAAISARETARLRRDRAEVEWRQSEDDLREAARAADDARADLVSAALAYDA